MCFLSKLVRVACPMPTELSYPLESISIITQSDSYETQVME